MAKQRFNFQSLNTTAPFNYLEPRPDTPTAASETSKSPLDSYKIIPRNKIRFNKRNDYPLDEIDKLKDLILHYGMLQDILVIYSTEEDIYIIEAGHRRTTALDSLINQFKDWEGSPDDPYYLLYQKNVALYERGYVCKVIDRLQENVDYDLADNNMSESVIDSEIRLIITNEGAREISPAVRAKNIQRLSHLLGLKNRGKEKMERLNINRTISEQMNISERQVINYKNTEKLIPELKELFSQEKFSLKTATAYSSLDPAEQMEIYNLISAGNNVTREQIQALKQETALLKSELNERLREIESLRESTSGEPGSPDAENLKAICNLLCQTITAYIKELRTNMDTLLLQAPDTEAWIKKQYNHLRDLL